jgi:hypothetical protein
MRSSRCFSPRLPAPPSLREGGECPKSSADGIEDALRVFVDLLVGEAQDGDASAAKERVAKSVAPLTTAVRFAVDLDGESTDERRRILATLSVRESANASRRSSGG